MKLPNLKGIKFTIAVLTIIFALSSAQLSREAANELPKAGDRYQADGTWYFVRGVGNKAFEYVATGESLVIKTIGIPGSLVRVPQKGDKVRIDPAIPMMWVNGKEDREFQTNSYLKKHAKNKVFLLLEYDRSANK